MGTILENAKNKTEKYICSNHSGLLKIVNKTDVILLNHLNTGTSGLESLTYLPDPTYKSVRPNGLKQDKDGNIWLANAYVNKALKVLKPGNNWQSYDLVNVISDASNERYGNIDIDKNGTKWIATF